jgi:lysozyme family protein
MANYDVAYDRTMKFEGGYTPDDCGSPAFMGINKRWWPNWNGWGLVKQWQEAGLKNDQNFLILIEMVKHFYRENYWKKVNGDNFRDQSLANEIFDAAVNSDPHDAILFMQSACNTLSPIPLLKLDGIFGTITSQTLNNFDNPQHAPLLLAWMRHFRMVHWQRSITSNPKLQKNLEGWTRRILT